MTTSRWSRRSVLRGLGATLALPWLEVHARAGTPPPPRRFVSFMVPNGMPMDRWHASGVGTAWTPSSILQPLQAHRDDVLLVAGIHSGPFAPIEPHAGAAAVYLTGGSTTMWGEDAPLDGRSLDMLLAETWAGQTAIGSLHLTSDPPTYCGEAVSGQLPSCMPYDTVSWAGTNQPVTHRSNLEAAFNDLFGRAISFDPKRASRDKLTRAVVDIVLDDAARLSRTLGVEDGRRLDRYLTGVHELERRLTDTQFDNLDGTCATDVEGFVDDAGFDQIAGIDAHAELTLDLITLALSCDRTRVVSYMLGAARSGRALPHLGIHDNRHAISHHGGDGTKLDQIEAIGRWEVELLAGLLTRLAAVPDGDARLLDHCAILFGSPISDPDQHSRIDLPIVLAGGALSTGKRVVYENMDIARLHLTIARRLGVPLSAFGDPSRTDDLADL